MKASLILCLALFSLTTYAQSGKSLIVVNGIAIKPNSSFADNIPVDQILSLKTYESAEAITKYGEFLGENGIIEIEAKTNSKGFIDVPEDSRLTYGDAKPVVLLDGKMIAYEKMNDIKPANIHSVEVSRNIDSVKDWGLQSINGIVKISSR